jgi:sugar lactone lactonase YvrE
MTVRIERIGEMAFTLGESPLWDPLEQVLYFVDGPALAIWRYDPAADAFASWSVPAQVGSLAQRERGGAVLACADGFHFFDFDTGRRSPIADPEADLPHTIFNDGKVDRQGRFVAGTLVRGEGEPRGALYALDPDLTVRTLDRDIICSNGPCWSPDGRTFYFADSGTGEIFAYDYDPASGAVAHRRVFGTTQSQGGAPDGATVDAEGYLWGAVCLGGRIVRYAPDGRVERVVEVPARGVTSVMFGGPALDVLYATSLKPSSIGAGEDGEYEGGLFAIYGLGVRGLPEPRFAG